MTVTNNIYSNTPENTAKAADVIKNGGLVAFPTDTVYGLGANVYDAKAVASIFAVKQRPAFDPLISHIADIDFLQEYAQTDSRVLDLAKHFWPGPLTFVLKRKDQNPALDLVCSGLPNIAVRMPNHQLALDLIKASGTPIAAPSANKFKCISPTTAQHVADSLGNEVNMILDGGACKIGVETTIIDLTTSQIVILRAGGLSKEDIEKFTGEKVFVSSGNSDKPSAPGQLLKHYAPKIPMRINVSENDVKKDEFYIGFGKSEKAHLNLSVDGNINEAASNLFAYMRIAENQKKYSAIAIAPIPNNGLGLAINDRIRRASYVD
ncbi:MAG: threonylcarbamoyl-AMP synthase [Alphaproteobacteria bacterium]|nr:threonylcarbamoyl-AMP synthase [Alphaproteobacteria bacterium]